MNDTPSPPEAFPALAIPARARLPTIPGLTGVRGVAALWVLLFHFRGVCETALGLPWLANVPIVGTGWSAVDMFFVLSGFVLMRSHGNDFTGLNMSPIIRFAKLRIARVYPVALVALALIAVVAADHEFVMWYRAQNPSNLTRGAFVKTALLATRWFLPGERGDWNQPVWSLSAEILGYAAFPLLALVLARRAWNSAIAIALTAIFALFLYQVVKRIDLDAFGQYPAVIRMACCFIAGAATAVASVGAPAVLEKIAARLSVIAVLLVLTGCLLPIAAYGLPFAYTLLILGLAFERGPVHWLLSSSFAQFLGRISFPLYLVHVMPLLWLGFFLHSTHTQPWLSWVELLLGMTLMILMASLLHLTVERPFHRWGRRWAG